MRAKLARHLFPDLSGVADALQIHLVELQPGGLQPLVVAGDAVLIEDGARGNRRGYSWACGYPPPTAINTKQASRMALVKRLTV